MDLNSLFEKRYFLPRQMHASELATMQKNGLLASAIMLISGTGAAQLIALLALPILSRLYTPAEFGLFSVYASLLSIATVMVCFRYELAIMLPKKERAAYQVYRLAAVASFLSSVLFGIFIYLFNDWLTTKYALQSAQYILWILPFSLFFTGLMTAVTSWNTRNRSYRLLTVSKLGQSIPQTAIQLLLGYGALGAFGLIAGELVGKISGLIIQWRGERSTSSSYNKQVSVFNLKKMAAIYRRFPLVSSWSSVINQLGVVAPAIFLAAHYGPEIAGFYAMTDRILAVPMDLVGRAVSSLYIGEASALTRKAPAQLKKLFIKFASRMLMLGFIPVVLIAVFGESVLLALLGAKWQQAGQFAQILSISFLFRFAISPLSQTLNMIERHDLQLLWDICRFVAVCVGFAAVVFLHQPPMAALAIYAAVVVVSQIIYALITVKQLGRLSC